MLPFNKENKLYDETYLKQEMGNLMMANEDNEMVVETLDMMNGYNILKVPDIVIFQK